MSATEATRKPELDALRGLAVAGMILVISPGDWDARYSPLKHADWNGWTLADMVFPIFLFSVGLGLGLASPRAWSGAAERRSFWQRVARRTFLLIVVGLLLEATGILVAYMTAPEAGIGLGTLRIPGVLQRIALCYALAVVSVVATARRVEARDLTLRPLAIAGVIAGLLLAYWALLTFVPVPGFGRGQLDPEGNLAAYLDRAIFSPAHLWPYGSVYWGGPVVYDPEGLLATFPATANVLSGVLAVPVWRARPQGASMKLALWGVGALLLGLALDPLFVINKRIWTSSFALLSGGFSALVFAALLTAAPSRSLQYALKPARVLGANAILAFVIATLLGRLYDLRFIASAGELMTPRVWLWHSLQAVVPDPKLASLGCAALFLVVVTALLWPLYERALHFRL